MIGSTFPGGAEAFQLNKRRMSIRGENVSI